MKLKLMLHSLKLSLKYKVESL